MTVQLLIIILGIAPRANGAKTRGLSLAGRHMAWLAGGWASDSTHLFTALKTRLLRPLASKHEQSATTQWFAGGVPVEKT